MSIKVTISWPAGSGKSSVVKEIVKQREYETADIGSIFRQMAIDRWLTIAEYDKLIEKNPEEDKTIDEWFRKLVEDSNRDIITSRRMGFYCYPKMLTIRLDVSPEEGARRIFKQNRGKQEKKYNNIKETMAANIDRMQRLQKRLLDVYNIDFMDTKNYDHIVNTDNKSFEQVVSKVISIIDTHYD